MINAFVKGTGAYLPENIVKNDFFEKIGSTDEWIYRNLGIKERRISQGETTSDLATKAAFDALKSSDTPVEDIDLIIVATATPDRQAPSCASMVQHKLNAINAAAFDISAVCSGAMFSTCVANQFIRTGMYQNILVIGADTFSTITDWNHRDSVFFGDGAGAILLSATKEDKGFIDFELHTDGSGLDHFTIPGGGSESPFNQNVLDTKSYFFQMNGKEVYRTAVEVVPKSIRSILSKNNISMDEVDFMVPHQPSIRILQDIAREVGMPFEKVLTNMDRYANTSGGTIPILLDENAKKGTFKKGDILLFAAIGAGMAWGTALYKW